MSHVPQPEANAESAQMQQHGVVAAPSTDAAPDLNEKFEAMKVTAESIRDEYEEGYKRIVAKISVEHFEPFGRIFLEREKKLITADAIAPLKDNLEKNLIEKLKDFWTVFNVTEELAQLEMLKEQCKGFEGINWNMNSMSPEERTRSIRMHLKKKRLYFLQRKLEKQNENLQEVQRTNAAHRQLIQEMSLKRVCLLEAMRQRSEQLPELGRDLSELMTRVVDAVNDL